MATEIPDKDIPWYCKRPECGTVESHNARSGPHTCPKCKTDMAWSVFGLPTGHPNRVPYDPPVGKPKPVHQIVEGEVTYVWHTEKHERGWWSMTVDTGVAKVRGTLPKAIMPSDPQCLVGQRVTLKADVTWFEPAKGWYRRPRQARVMEGKA